MLLIMGFCAVWRQTVRACQSILFAVLLFPWASKDALFAQERVIFSDTLLYQLAQCNLDGSNYSDLVFLSSLSEFVLAYDYLEDKLYWTDSFSNAVVKADSNGTNRSNILSGLSAPTGIAVDPVNSKIYFTQADGGSGVGVFRAGLDGSNKETLLDSTSFGSPDGIALDIANGKMYISDGEMGTIERANLDGTSLEELASSLSQPRGLFVDTFNDKLYFAESGAGLLRRANLDGTGLETVVDLTSMTGSPRYLQFNPADGFLYWTDPANNGVFRKVPGSVATPSLLHASSQPQGIVLVLSCTSTSPDSDGDATPDCNDNCPASSIKSEPGTCGCTVADTDSDNDKTPDCNDTCPNDENKSAPGFCGCGAFEVDYGAGDECEDAPALTPDTEIDEAPQVTVKKKNKVVLTFEDFSGGTLVSQSALPAFLRRILGAREKLAVRYSAVIRGRGNLQGDLYRRTTKRNTLTLRNLTAGRYSVRYKAQALRKKKVVFSSGLSPSVNFRARN